MAEDRIQRISKALEGLRHSQDAWTNRQAAAQRSIDVRLERAISHVSA